MRIIRSRPKNRRFLPNTSRKRQGRQKGHGSRMNKRSKRTKVGNSKIASKDRRCCQRFKSCKGCGRMVQDEENYDELEKRDSALKQKNLRNSTSFNHHSALRSKTARESMKTKRKLTNARKVSLKRREVKKLDKEPTCIKKNLTKRFYEDLDDHRNTSDEKQTDNLQCTKTLPTRKRKNEDKENEPLKQRKTDARYPGKCWSFNI